MIMGQKGKKKSHYIRVATFKIDEVLPFVFTREIRHTLRAQGFRYDSNEWKTASRRGYQIYLNGKDKTIKVSMGSHRYQLFALKGIKCTRCGIEGEYFALERDFKTSPDKFHFNLYGNDSNGQEIMITKDHVIPRSKGGKNKLNNYQPMCFRCNQKKADKLYYVKD